MRGDHRIGLDRLPQQCAQPGGISATQVVGSHDAVDHVGQHRHPRTIAQADRHQWWTDPTTTDGAVDAEHPGWAAEAGRHQTLTAGHLRHGAGGGGESEGGRFHGDEYGDPL